MKILVTYSSQTGNTRRLAEAIAAGLSGEVTLCPVKESPATSGYDQLLHGFWVTTAGADELSLEYLAGIREREISLFGTMGANPETAYGRSIASRLKNHLKRNQNTIGNWFLCKGEIDPALIAWMKTLPEGHPQYPTPERRQNWEAARGHPDAADLAHAMKIFCSA
ncbi:MAG: flavodoxin family protein, partial [Verrucomicrobiota bacterium]